MTSTYTCSKNTNTTACNFACCITNLQDVSRNTLVSPINSTEQYYLVDIIDFILNYLKNQLYEALGKNSPQFDWVVTVPAIWDIRGKQMMREAAYKVSIEVPSMDLIRYALQ